MKTTTAASVQALQNTHDFLVSDIEKKRKLATHLGSNVLKLQVDIKGLSETLRLKTISMESEISGIKETTTRQLNESTQLKNALAKKQEALDKELLKCQSIINDKASLDKKKNDAESATLKQKEQAASDLRDIKQQREVLRTETENTQSVLDQQSRNVDESYKSKNSLLDQRGRSLDGRDSNLSELEKKADAKTVTAQNTINEYRELLVHHKGLILGTEAERDKVREDHKKLSSERSAVAAQAKEHDARKIKQDEREKFLNDREQELLAYKGELSKQTSRAKEEAIKKRVTWDDNLKL